MKNIIAPKPEPDPKSGSVSQSVRERFLTWWAKSCKPLAPLPKMRNNKLLITWNEQITDIEHMSNTQEVKN